MLAGLLLHVLASEQSGHSHSVCPASDLQAIIPSLSAGCQATLTSALANNLAVESSVYCPCYLEVPSATMLAFDCLGNDQATHTIREDYQECAYGPECDESVGLLILPSLSAGCQATLTQSTTRPDDSVYCPCLLEVPSATMSGLQCRFPDSTLTVAKEYEACAGSSAGSSASAASAASADPEVILWEATCPGDLTTLLNDATAQAKIKDGIAASAGVDKEYVDVQYLPGSIKLFAVIGIPAGQTASTVAASVGASLGSPTAASAAIGITVASVDAVSTTTSSAASSTVVNAGGSAVVAQWNQALDAAVGLATTILIVVIVVPTVVVLCLISLIVYCCCCRKKAEVKAVSAA